MFKNLIGSIQDNLKEKTTNPFLGTYTMVWIIRHWELIFGIFSFSDDWKLYQKIYFIQTELNKFDIIIDVGWNILITLGVLVATYILLNLSRLIINFFEKVVTPYIYKWTDSNSIVLKSTFEKVRNERDEFRKRFDDERDTRSGFEDKIIGLNEEINNHVTTKISIEKLNQDFSNKEKKYQEEYLALENSIAKLTKNENSYKDQLRLIKTQLSNHVERVNVLNEERELQKTKITELTIALKSERVNIQKYITANKDKK